MQFVFLLNESVQCVQLNLCVKKIEFYLQKHKLAIILIIRRDGYVWWNQTTIFRLCIARNM